MIGFIYSQFKACRSKEKALAAKDEITKLTGFTNLEFMALDLTSQDSIRGFVKEYKQKNYPCDVLINNAGVFYLYAQGLGSTPALTKDGHTMEWMSNYLGHFLLTNLMLDTISKSSGKIVNVTSVTHFLSNGRDSSFLEIIVFMMNSFFEF